MITVQAQESADRLMDRMMEAFVDQDEISFDFNLLVSIPDQNDIELNGTLHRSGSKYNAKLGDRWVKTNGETQWVYDPDLGEVQIYDASDDNALPLSPSEILKIYNKEDFDFDITGKEGVDQNLLYLMEFKPKDKSADVVKAKMTIHQSTALPRLIQVIERDGMQYTLKLENVNTSPTYTSGEFTFNPKNFPNLRVEDLRLRE